MAETLEVLVEERELNLEDMLGEKATEVAFGQMSFEDPEQLTLDV